MRRRYDRDYSGAQRQLCRAVTKGTQLLEKASFLFNFKNFQKVYRSTRKLTFSQYKVQKIWNSRVANGFKVKEQRKIFSPDTHTSPVKKVNGKLGLNNNDETRRDKNATLLSNGNGVHSAIEKGR